MKKLITICLLISLCSCSWSARNKAWFGALVAGQAADVYGSSRINPEKGTREGNPIMARPDGAPRLDLMLALKLAFVAYVAYSLDDDNEYALPAVAILSGVVGGWAVYATESRR